MGRVVLHIGPYKTGSTSIQQMLWLNRDLLQDYGFRYAETLLRGRSQFNMNALANLPTNSDWEPTKLDPLVVEMTEHANKRIIFSSEGLSGGRVDRLDGPRLNRTLKRLRDLLSDHDVEVVAYIRRQDESIESRILQAIKGQARSANLLAEPYMSDGSGLDYCKVLQVVTERLDLPKTSVSLRPFQSSMLYGGDVRRDFLKFLGLPVDEFDLTKLHANVSPAGRTIAMIRAANLLLDGRRADRSLYKRIWQMTRSQNHEKAIVLDSETRQRVTEWFIPANEALIRDWVPDNAKTSFEELLLSPAKTGLRPNIYCDFEEIYELFEWRDRTDLVPEHWMKSA